MESASKGRPYNGVLYPVMSVAPIVIRSLALVWQSVAFVAMDSTTVEDIGVLRIGTDPPPLSLSELGVIVNGPTA
jgi:hypothetical protein